MSKERLEEIKSKYKGDIYDCKLGRFDIQWLIEQAERVQELEDFIYQDTRQAVLEGLYEENERYREVIKVIEKYANDCIDVEVEMNPYLVLDDIKTLEEME